MTATAAVEGDHEKRAAAVLQRLEARHAARKQEAQQQQQAGSGDVRDPKESVDAFYAAFNVARSDVDAGIAGLSSRARDDMRGAIDGLAADVQALEQSASEAAYYLPPYDQRSVAGTLSELRAALEAARRQLAPAKKFAFSRRAAPAAAAAAAPHGDAAACSAAGAGCAGGGGTAGASTAGAVAELASASPASASAHCAAPGAARGGSAAAAVGADCEAARAVARADPSRAIIGLRGQVVVRRVGGAGGSARGTGSGASAGGVAGGSSTATRDGNCSADSDAGGGACGGARASGGGGASAAPGSDFVLSGLEDCDVWLLGPLSALWLYKLRRCRVYCGPVAGATFADELEDCTLMAASHQVRLHRATRCDFYLRVRSHPIIEHSSGCRFAPCQFSYPGMHALLQECGLGEDGGQWQAVQDFGWLRATQSPHWSILPEAERAPPPEVPRTTGEA